MIIREKIRYATDQLLNAESDQALHQVVRKHQHILPTWAIARVFDRLQPYTMAAITAYIPPRLYARIPIEYAEYIALCPLIFMRPDKELREGLDAYSYEWRRRQRRNYKRSLRRRLLPGWDDLRGLSVREINDLMRIVVSGERRDPDSGRYVHPYWMPEYALRIMDVRLFKEWIRRHPEGLNISTVGTYLANGVHYEVIDYILRRCIDDENTTATLLNYDHIYRISHSSLVFRLSPRVRAWLAYYACRRWGDIFGQLRTDALTTHDQTWLSRYNVRDTLGELADT